MAAVAAVMFVHGVPLSAERCHCNVKVLPVPDQAPVVEDSVLPRWAMPRIVGRLLLDGGEVPTGAVGFEGALMVPSGLETVTRMRTIAPSSPTPSAYVVEVAPAMLD